MKSVAKKVLRPFRRQISDAYVEVLPQQVNATAKQLRSAWQDRDLPARQRELVREQMRRYRNGESNAAFDTLVDCLRPLSLGGASLLEVGCSSGYYSEVLTERGLSFKYHGCDYSDFFVSLARECYPGLPFDVADATRLPYADQAFDVIVSGCCLLHIPEYEEAVKESARTARRYVVFHRTPVLARSPTRHFVKEAYGVKTIEIHFNEGELIRLFAAHGLDVIDIRTITADWNNGDAFLTKTYVCRKSADREVS